MPASISSAITQKPPWRLSSDLMPRGFRISKNLKSTKEATTYRQSTGQAISGIHTPIISSITTRLGSSPQIRFNWSVHHEPITVENRIAAMVIHINAVVETKQLHISHITTASKAPIVPGPQGQYPTPNPVAQNAQNFSFNVISTAKLPKKSEHLQTIKNILFLIGQFDMYAVHLFRIKSIYPQKILITDVFVSIIQTL